jgi:hypothetical protein
MAATDPCKLAPLPANKAMTVQLVGVGGGPDKKRTATVTFSLKASDIVNHAGATGQDAWVVVRVRGQHAMFPILLGHGEITDGNIDTLVSGNDADVAAALDKKGVPAEAFTGPIFLDYDGGGYKAPFAP